MAETFLGQQFKNPYEDKLEGIKNFINGLGSNE